MPMNTFKHFYAEATNKFEVAGFEKCEHIQQVKNQEL